MIKRLSLPFFFLISSCLIEGSEHDTNKRTSSNYLKQQGYSRLSIVDARRNSAKYALKQKYTAKDINEHMIKSVGYTFEEYQEEYLGHYKIGQPYEIKGVTYHPQEYEDYQEVGQASWYGDDFHGKATANGEVYNMRDMTAAHRTLPLPSIIKVTNLDNGKTAIVRVNDRGPFSKSRVIDVSEKAADALGFKGNGTTEVKIELLRNDTDELLQKLKIKN